MRRSTNNDRRVGLIYDERMCNHYAPDDDEHPESPARIRAIWDRLNSSGLAKRCVVLKAKEADDKHLALVHKRKHIDLIKNISSRSSAARKKTAAKCDSIYFNEGSSEAAYLAAGSVIEVADKVAKGELDSAFAIVRPPGHHAEQNKPRGFCLHNNVAIATKYILNERRELGVKKILIVDWDVHHGNGTQKMFYNDPRVLFFSVHRFDSGNFYPSGPEGSYSMTGEEPGSGYNINVPWENDRCGDADYVAVWDQILVHVAKEFNPDLIMISAGFDAAEGDPLGGCRVSPYGFSILLEKLLAFAGGKIVMALEGGYNLDSIANSAHACVEVLIQGKTIVGSLEDFPLNSTWRVIQEVRQELSTYWPSLAGKLPHNETNMASTIKITSSNSGSDHENLFPSKAHITNHGPIQSLLKRKLNKDSQDDAEVSGGSKSGGPATKKGKMAMVPKSAGAGGRGSSPLRSHDDPFFGVDPKLKKQRNDEPEFSEPLSSYMATKSPVSLEELTSTVRAKVKSVQHAWTVELEGVYKGRQKAELTVLMLLQQASIMHQAALKKKVDNLAESLKEMLRQKKASNEELQAKLTAKEVEEQQRAENPFANVEHQCMHVYYCAYFDVIRILLKGNRSPSLLVSKLQEDVKVKPLHEAFYLEVLDLEEEYGFDLSWWPNRDQLVRGG